MRKVIVTSLFSLILMASVIAPTYISLTEGNCEITEIVDFGEEEENKGKESVKDLELKIYYSYNNGSLFIGLEKKKRVSFYSKDYNSFHKKLTSPPPEGIS